MRLLLVQPRSFAVSYGDMRFVGELTGRSGLLGVALPTLAALTPPGLDVHIVDENVEPVDLDAGWDLVGFTGFHTQIDRARQLAAEVHARGIPLVCGGPSVSVSPERWRPFADHLVIGEAERTWPRFCEDFLAGRAEPTYTETGTIDLAETPVPDYRPVSATSVDRTYGGIVQTSRGCPFACEFCDVIVYVGRKMRYKPVDTILAEVRQLDAMGKPFVVLADDNFTAGRQRSRGILEALGAENRRRRVPLQFATQLSIDVARDTDLLRLATEAGLNRVLIGIESPDEASLREANKLHNVRADLVRDLATFHEHGMIVMGTSIVGFDNDDLSIFRRQLEFFQEAGVLSPQPYPLQAPDGTPLKERAQREGRYRGWHPDVPVEEINNFNTFTLQPANMSLAQLRDGLVWLMRELYATRAVLARAERWFDQYDGAGGGLDIPRLGASRSALGIAGRLLRYAARGADADERDLLARLMGRAARSRHPQRLGVAVTVFLNAVNVRRMMVRLRPDAYAVGYPT